MNSRKVYSLVTLMGLVLGGCAISEKPPVRHQPTYTPPVQQQPVQYSTSTPENSPKQLQSPRYLDLGSDDETVVTEDIEATLPSMAYINDRIFEYGRKLDKWKELDQQSVNQEISEEDASRMVRCFRRLQNVLNGYGDLRTRMLQTVRSESAEKLSNAEIFKLQKADISFLENECGRMLVDQKNEGAGWNRREDSADLAQLETLIDRYSSSKEYEEVIQVWSQIPEEQLGRVHLRTRLAYGNALIYLHQEEKAAEIYGKVVEQMAGSDEQATDLVSLRKVLGDLYTAAGRYSEAAEQYSKISKDYETIGKLEEWSKLQLSILDKADKASPELTGYTELLRNYLGFIAERDGYKVIWDAEKFLTDYPYSPVAANVDIIKESLVKEADEWFTGLLGQADSLAAEKRFTEALELLETIPPEILGAERQIALKEKNDELLLAEAVEKETQKMAKLQELQHQWNNGMLLAKSGRYDEAIAVFTQLLDTDYSQKAEAKIGEVSLEAAKADRKKAADIFVRFTKTTDLDGKKKLLVECRKVLKNILVKYPEVQIREKVLGNIQRVEQEMNAIDPTLIALSDSEITPDTAVDGIDQAFGSGGGAPQTDQAQGQVEITEKPLEVPLSQ